jgi:hypothetical protein
MLFVESIHYDYGLRGSAASRLPSSVFSSLAIHLSSFHCSTWPAPSEVANSEACASAGFRAPRWSVPGRRQLHVRGILGARHRPGDVARARGGDAGLGDGKQSRRVAQRSSGQPASPGVVGSAMEPPPVAYRGAASKTETKRFDSYPVKVRFNPGTKRIRGNLVRPSLNFFKK